MDNRKLELIIQLGLIGAIFSDSGQRLRNGLGLASLGLLPDAVLSDMAKQFKPVSQQTTAPPAQAQTAIMPSSIKKPSPDPQTLEADEWLRLIVHPTIVLILGKRGSGKSALGYRLLEHLRYTANPYVIGLSKEARTLLPDWIEMAASLEEVPPKAIVLVDEAYLPYHARNSMACESKAMSQALNLSRQRKQTIIFISQEARQVDRNIASSSNTVIFKDLGMLQLQFDRREFAQLATQAKEAFITIKGDKRPWSFVYAPDADFTGLVENSLPALWQDKLSHIFAIGSEITTRAPKKMPLDKRIERAKELSLQGLSLGQIAKQMGVSKPTIKNYLEDYPYKAKLANTPAQLQ